MKHLDVDLAIVEVLGSIYNQDYLIHWKTNLFLKKNEIQGKISPMNEYSLQIECDIQALLGYFATE